VDGGGYAFNGGDLHSGVGVKPLSRYFHDKYNYTANLSVI
jgi:hypothetical protein